MSSTLFPTAGCLLAQVPISAATISRALIASPDVLSYAQLEALRASFCPGSVLTYPDVRAPWQVDLLAFGMSIEKKDDSGLDPKSFFSLYSSGLTAAAKPVALAPMGSMSAWHHRTTLEMFSDYIEKRPTLKRAVQMEAESLKEAFKQLESAPSDDEFRASAMTAIMLEHFRELAMSGNSDPSEEAAKIYRGEFQSPVSLKHPIGKIIWDLALEKFNRWKSDWRTFMLAMDAGQYLLPSTGAMIRGAGRNDTKSVEGTLYKVLKDNLPAQFKADVAVVKEPENPAQFAKMQDYSQDVSAHGLAPQAQRALPPWLTKLAQTVVDSQMEIWNEGPSPEANKAAAVAMIAAYEHRERPGFLELIRRPLNDEGVYAWGKPGAVLNWMNVQLSAARKLAGGGEGDKPSKTAEITLVAVGKSRMQSEDEGAEEDQDDLSQLIFEDLKVE